MKFKTVAGVAALGAAAAFCWEQNNRLEVTEYTVASPRLPAAFDGLRVAHISDLHNKLFGPQQRRLMDALGQLRPELILVTGDLVDNTESANALCFVEQAVQLAPVYYTPGNHEERHGQYPLLRRQLAQRGVTVLHNLALSLNQEGQQLWLAGIGDPNFFPYDCRRQLLRQTLATLRQDCGEAFMLLLAHRPQLLPQYAVQGADLVLAGHAHGGQFRLPGGSGLFTPDQGPFPAYSEGVYWLGKTAMVVSRGLGNAQFPLRLNNHPEVVALTLRRQEG